MPNLEEILRKNIVTARNFLVSQLDLTPEQIKRLKVNEPEIILEDKLEGYAAFAFSTDNKYAFVFRPEAVNDPLAVAEEVAHSIRLILNEEARRKLFHTNKDTEENVALVGLEEYFGRYGALMYLNHLKIAEYNKLWSQIAGGRVTLYTTQPADAKSHFLGYVQAEIDFKRLGIQGFKDALFACDTSVLKDAYQLDLPKIKLAA